MKKKKQNKWNDPQFAYSCLARDNFSKWWPEYTAMKPGKKSDPRLKRGNDGK